MKELNNNIQESYCSFEVSKLLKEKGMHIKSINRLIDERGSNGKGVGPDVLTDLIPQPTHALAIEWIRVNFGIWIPINPKREKVDGVNEMWYDAEVWKLEPNEIKGYGWAELCEPWETPQEATEAALLYTLQNLIP